MPNGCNTVLFLLLCISNDIHPHPGPPRRSPMYPCGVCHKAVLWSHTRRAVACDTCRGWYHIDCMGMHSATYEAVNRSDLTWICAGCNTPNYSIAVLYFYIDTSISSFSLLVLSSLNSDTKMSTHSVHSDSQIGSPLLRSSPIHS